MNANTLLAKKQIDNSFTTQGGVVTVTGTDTDTSTKTSGWDWSAAWNGITHITDTLVNAFAKPNYENYPQQYPQTNPTTQTITYAVIGLFVLIALALVFKIVK